MLLLLAVDFRKPVHIYPPHRCKYLIFANPLANWLAYMQHVNCSFDTFEWYFLGCSGPLWCVQFFYVFASYSSALQASLAPVQGFPLMVTKHNSTALKKIGMTKDIFIKFRHGRDHFWSVGRGGCVNIGLPSLRFVQNYPSSISKTLQSWCEALKDFRVPFDFPYIMFSATSK